MNTHLSNLKWIFALFLLGTLNAELSAQLSLTGLGTPATIDFESTLSNVNNGTFAGGGFDSSPSSGQLDSDAWSSSGFNGANASFGGSCTSDDCARGTSTGNETQGGVYAFDTGSGNAALGVQPGGSDFTAGSFTLRVDNNTGSTFNTISISYDIFVFNDQARANSLNFSYSTDGSNFIDLPALDYTSPGTSTGDNWSTAINRSISFNLSIANGGSIFLRWTGDDVSGSGSRDEFAIDNISVTGAVSLPIELASFEARATDKTVELEWLVLSETDNDFMAIERSIDGKHFTELGTVKGRGNSEQAQLYNFIDQAPLSGQNYYRIRQVDFDGTSNYSELKAIEWKNTNANIRVYPTQVTDQLTLEIFNAKATQAELQIFTPAGHLVHEWNLNTDYSNQTIDLSNLDTGVYFLKFQLDNYFQTIKIFKQ